MGQEIVPRTAGRTYKLVLALPYHLSSLARRLNTQQKSLTKPRALSTKLSVEHPPLFPVYEPLKPYTNLQLVTPYSGQRPPRP